MQCCPSDVAQAESCISESSPCQPPLQTPGTGLTKSFARMGPSTLGAFSDFARPPHSGLTATALPLLTRKTLPAGALPVAISLPCPNGMQSVRSAAHASQAQDPLLAVTSSRPL